MIRFGHWFDGLSILHRFEITSGKVQYRNRFIGEAYNKELAKTGAVGTTFGTITEPCSTIFRKMKSVFQPAPDAFNINVTQTPNFNYGPDKKNRFLVKTDANAMIEVEPTELEPQALLTYADFNSELKGVWAASHEEFDPKTQSYINFVLNPGPSPKFTVFEMTPENPTGVILGSVSHELLSYVHSFSSTSRYVVLILCPLFYSYMGIPMLLKIPVTDIFKWDPKKPTVFAVIDRQKKQVVAKFSMKSFFVFHTINAFDDGDDIVIDLSAYENADLVWELELAKLRSVGIENINDHRKKFVANVQRIRLPDISKASTKFRPNDSSSANLPEAKLEFDLGIGAELQRIHPSKRHDGSYRYIYAVSSSQTEQHT